MKGKVKWKSKNTYQSKEGDSTRYSIYMNVTFFIYMCMKKTNIFTSFQSSPPPFCPEGRSTDIDAIINVISTAEHFIYISVMDYFPLQIYTPRPR